MRLKHREGAIYKKMKTTSGNSGKKKTKVPGRAQAQPEPKVMVLDARTGATRMIRP